MKVESTHIQAALEKIDARSKDLLDRAERLVNVGQVRHSQCLMDMGIGWAGAAEVLRAAMKKRARVKK